MNNSKMSGRGDGHCSSNGAREPKLHLISFNCVMHSDGG